MKSQTQKVNWSELKKEIGSDYSNTPFAAIEQNNNLKNRCERVLFSGGEIVIDPKEAIGGLFILIKGLIAIGDKIEFQHKRQTFEYFVEKTLLNPFSFIGEIEAPLLINGKLYNKMKSQNFAWVTSSVLSKIMAYDVAMQKIRIPFDIKSQTYEILTELIEEGNLIFEKAYLERIADDVIDENYDAKQILNLLEDRKVDLPSDIRLFTKGCSADLLKIPMQLSQEIWNDEKIRKYVCEDAFIKSKKYWILPHDDNAIKLSERLTAVYQHAELNDLLVDGSFYIFGLEKLRAIIDDNSVLRGINITAIENALNKNKLTWTAISNSKVKKFYVSDSNLLKYFRYLSVGRGNNSVIYKISRMSNT